MKILIVDDHDIVREGLRLVLELKKQHEVIGEAENGQQALEMLEILEPELILLDLNMPVLDGIGVLRALKKSGRQIPVIVLTTYKEKYMLLEAVELGVKSYLLKDAKRSVIYETLTKVANGETWFPPDIEKAITVAKDSQANKLFLTQKELLILNYLSKGLKNSEIADKLFISERTLKNYLTVIYEKLQVKSRTQALSVAIEKNLI